MSLICATVGEERSQGGYVAIGNFDGVHVGHAEIVSVLVDQARSANVPAVVLTFDPHPVMLLRPDKAPPRLSTLADRGTWLGALGVDVLVVYSTTLEMLALEPETFFDQVVRGQFKAVGMVEGPNFCFGKGRAGTIETLGDLCRENDLPLEVVRPMSIGDRLVSSSAIREMLKTGAVDEAGQMLGRRYQVRGMVVAGEGRGRALGIPTANLERIETLVPCEGVYAAGVRFSDGVIPAAVNVGANPTFGEERSKLEVHLLDFDEDLYGQELEIEFCQRLRDVVAFESVQELQEQLLQDIELVRKWFATAGH